MSEPKTAVEPDVDTVGSLSAHVLAERGPPKPRPEVTVLNSDVTSSMQGRIIEIALAALDTCTTRTDMARHIKETCDKLYGATWHCFVGSTYGCQVKFAKGYYTFFQVGKLYFCVFRSPPLAYRSKPKRKPPVSPPDVTARTKVLISKMDASMEAVALSVVCEAKDRHHTYKEMAMHAKETMDDFYGSGWLCFYGLKNTGSFVTNAGVDYVSLNVDEKVRVLLFRHHDESDVLVPLTSSTLADGAKSERLYVQVLSAQELVIRTMYIVLLALQVLSIIGTVVIAPYWVALAGILHLYGFYAAIQSIPYMLHRYTVVICVNIATTALANAWAKQYCDKWNDPKVNVDYHYNQCDHVTWIWTVFITCYALQAISLVMTLVFARIVQQAVKRVASASSNQPLLQNKV